jgi:hypothetical protein
MLEAATSSGCVEGDLGKICSRSRSHHRGGKIFFGF